MWIVESHCVEVPAAAAEPPGKITVRGQLLETASEGSGDLGQIQEQGMITIDDDFVSVS